jgi:hypothetical protein
MSLSNWDIDLGTWGKISSGDILGGLAGAGALGGADARRRQPAAARSARRRDRRIETLGPARSRLAATHTRGPFSRSAVRR